MAAYGYSHVTDRAFSAFVRDLGEGAWKEVSVEAYDAADRAPSSPLLEAPRAVAWKLRAVWCISDLAAVLGIASAEDLARLDAAWDSAQRALHLFLGAAAEDQDPAVRDAAGRLRGALLAGGGIEQTTYSYDGEVDFGWHQLAMVGEESLAADVEKVGLEKHLKRVEEATAALAKGIGRAPGQKRPASRSKRIREAVAACTTTFNLIHEDIVWLIEHTPSGEHRERLE